ncbi:MAG TPA: septal ring lytic transglycosylase RlpA family protein [Kiloniellaceae bacterium]|nr:septal ring lytic transglycosylase RlpA family protein [Kiloniellaceae bacterium]
MTPFKPSAFAAFALIAAVFLSGCAGPSARESGASASSGSLQPRAAADSATADSATAGRALVGEASWYGVPYHGRTTASGETFNMNAMTAAHKTLPFGTKVKVTNLANGRAVQVVINDRGPFVPGRIIDLSRAAADKIDMIKAGVAKVRVEVLG